MGSGWFRETDTIRKSMILADSMVLKRCPKENSIRRGSEGIHLLEGGLRGDGVCEAAYRFKYAWNESYGISSGET